MLFIVLRSITNCRLGCSACCFNWTSFCFRKWTGPIEATTNIYLFRMPKTKYCKWSVEELNLAINAFRKGELGLNASARTYNVPKATLKRHLESKNKIANTNVKFHGGVPTFSNDIEIEIKKHLLKLEEMMFGLTPFDVRKLAFDIAEKNNLPHSFNKETRCAGKKWYYSFMRRNPDLSLRQPENTSIARAKGFNRQNVQQFFDLLERICDENKLDATRIFNVDESGFSTVQKRCQKVIAAKGKKQVSGIASGERGVNTTFVCCVSAAGQYIPPMVIFKRKRMAPELQVGAPAGSLIEISETGYIDSELFLKWLQFFIDTVNPTKEKKILLCLDGHTTHSKNLRALELAREHGVILLQLPGHTTHKLQPLDVSFFKPLETFYIQEMQKFLRTYPNLTISLFQIAQIFTPAYQRAATIENAASGFKSTGIWPVNRNVFAEHEYAAADNLQVAPIPMDIEITESEQNEEFRPLTPNNEENNATPRSTTKLVVSVAEISPVPQPKSKKGKRISKGAQKACVLTESPYKNDLEAKKMKS